PAQGPIPGPESRGAVRPRGGGERGSGPTRGPPRRVSGRPGVFPPRKICRGGCRPRSHPTTGGRRGGLLVEVSQGPRALGPGPVACREGGADHLREVESRVRLDAVAARVRGNRGRLRTGRPEARGGRVRRGRG